MPSTTATIGTRTNTRDPGKIQRFAALGVATSLVFSNAAGRDVITASFKQFQGAQRDELMFISDTLSGGLNVMGVQNLNATGYSAFIVRDNLGVERMAIGVGNSGSPQADVVYFEASYFTGSPHSTVPPTVKFQQTGYMFGAYGQYNRMVFTNAGRIWLIKDDGTAGFVFDSATSSVAIGTALPAAIANSKLDVWGTAVFGDTQSARTNAAPSGATNPAIGINHSTGVFMRAIYPTIGTFEMRMTGNTTTRALEFVNTDNSNLVMISMKLNGTGRVDIRQPASATMAAASSYANDAAAAGGGVAIGDFYRNGSVVQVRVT
jgi:hypothetical protein